MTQSNGKYYAHYGMNGGVLVLCDTMPQRITHVNSGGTELLESYTSYDRVINMKDLFKYIKEFCEEHDKKTFTFADVRHMTVGYQEMIYLENSDKIERIEVHGNDIEWRIT